MTKNLLVLSIVLAALSHWSCGDKSVEVSVKNPREFKWTIDTLAYPGSYQTLMFDVWASSPSDVYLVGYNSQSLGVMWHFNGKSWSDIKLHVTQGGNVDGAAELSGIAGLNSKNIYAVGKTVYSNWSPPPNFLDTSLILHFDGTTWREENIQKGVQLLAVSATTQNNVWACGRNGLVYHFDGTMWTKDSVRLAVPNGGEYYLSDVKARTSGDETYLLGYIHENRFARTTWYFFVRNNNEWSLRDTMVFEPDNVVESFGSGGLWVSPQRTLYSFGGSVHRWTGSGWLTILSTGMMLGRMAGTSDDNIFAVGGFGMVWHFNGIDWYQFKEVKYPDLVYSSVWTDGKEVFVVGYTTLLPQQTVILHGR